MGAIVSYLRSGRTALGEPLGRIATRSILDESWDRVVYACVGVAVVTAAACAVFPRVTELAVFGWLMFLTNSPFGLVLPSAAESLVMAFGRLYPPLLLAAVGVVAIALVEWLNYRVFGAVLFARPLTPLRSARLTRRLQALFSLQPFATTVVAAAIPVPFWVVRVCAVCSGYAPERFILATTIGRFPRFWFWAVLGTALPLAAVLGLLVAGVLVLSGAGLVARYRSGSALPAPAAEGRREGGMAGWGWRTGGRA